MCIANLARHSERKRPARGGPFLPIRTARHTGSKVVKLAVHFTFVAVTSRSNRNRVM